mgnify:CR=1 FL=1
MSVFVDTEIWCIAQKEPAREKFKSEEEYEEQLMLHLKAKKFLEDTLRNKMVYMTYHQVAEIYHVLGFRGTKLPLDFVNKYIKAILESERIIKIPIEQEHISLAVRLSAESGIHIWDFLCIIPIIDYIEIAYTVDSHFRHKVFKKLGIKIDNPLGKWFTL